MPEATEQEPFMPADPAKFTANLGVIAERTQRVIAEMARMNADPSLGDPFNIVRSFIQATTQLLADPNRNLHSQLQLWQDYAKLYGTMFTAGEPLQGQTPRNDRRFRDPAWESHPVFNLMKQSYLLASQWVDQQVKEIPGVDDRTAMTVRFYTRQFVDALAPSNFVLTNPEVLRETLESSGDNLVRGLDNLLEDLDRGNGDLVVKMTDLDAFKVGKNVAVSRGSVVFQNDVMQLIQYAPTTETVYRRPLLIVPPWINKFYILDLRPENSLIRWCVDQGYTVFVVSWVNPDEALAEKTYEDYIIDGPIAAMDAIEQATGERELSVVGYCIGGTLISSTLAYMEAIKDRRVKACTLFATQVDFSEPGELGVFIDDAQISGLEQRMEQRGGILDGAAMASAFNMLRSNDLIWSFVVNNYLLGREPLPFDLLYWNSDATRIPAPLHSYYLRNMYLDNKMVVPNALTVRGVPIDIHKIKTPIFAQAAHDDHIAPYPSVFRSTQCFAGQKQFVLAGSGHIAGVVNPPAAQKYQYWTNPNLDYTSGQAWFAEAEVHQGSWWPHWHAWLSKKSGRKVPARQPGDGALPVIEEAPGSYVLVRSDRLGEPAAAEA